MSISLRILFASLTASAVLATAVPSYAVDLPTFSLAIRAGHFVPDSISSTGSSRTRLTSSPTFCMATRKPKARRFDYDVTFKV